MNTHSSTHIYLIRHGETDWNAARRIQGHSDIPLNQAGREQALRLAEHLQHIPIDRICVSDLQRAVETARPLAACLGLPLHRFYEFRERNYGEWEGKKYEEVQAEIPDVNTWTEQNRRYNIETFTSMQQRGMNCLQSILQENRSEHLAVISHGGMLNALLHHMSSGEYGTGKTRWTNTACTHVEYRADTWIVHTINDGSHLQ
ncbi:putative phosphoglycerate mutase/uncharacterized phosphatase [Aneurinibacillus soli]|uniref:Alpha-ribazole phosphatase n=1 Tax=Aneurinibacillus soli TaxID=1500254 RepID=A0A0U5BCG6_9BACL|nr:histidine phosphatase family protein [Aneurinibacillus soli]PYE59697.1 putative phosphoglycerate mutase/uncharacterized phosphatase [Aneurinibacillus soli]BAU29302.1 Alpha-ribazole phosphatase [Aneurinibacillus soli]